jgi:serine protease Do
MKLALILLTAVLAQAAPAQDEADYPALPRARYRSGQAVLDAFAPISAQTRDSIVELNVDESPVALGAVVDTNGLALTKASELGAGKLTCWLATGEEVQAQLLAVDDDDDVALVRVKAEGLKPIQWATNQVVEGQWVITPCLADTPLAVGIISALSRRIQPPQRALIGVGFDWYATRPTVDILEPGFGAEEAGVKPGDIVLAVDGTSVTNSEQVMDILREFRDGQTVHIRFKRDEREFDASIKMMTAKPGQDGYDYASERENQLSGDVSLRSGGFEQAIEHDTVLEPWQCGGPLVNLDGKAIGLNIARASRVATYALPASLARQILTKLKAEAEKP